MDLKGMTYFPVKCKGMNRDMLFHSGTYIISFSCKSFKRWNISSLSKKKKKRKKRGKRKEKKRKSSKPRYIHNNTKGEILPRGQKRKRCPRIQAKVTFLLQWSCDLNVKITQTFQAHISTNPGTSSAHQAFPPLFLSISLICLFQ